LSGEEIKYPVIVKPKMESVSYGLKIVNDDDELLAAIKFIVDEFQQPALVEQFIRGREFAVGFLGNNPIEAFPVLEFDLGNPDGIQTFEDKSQKPKSKICPAELSDELSSEITKISTEAFKSLQLRDFARVDLRMDENGNVYILEINSMASLGPTGSYVHAASIAGYTFPVLVNKMLDVAVLRYYTATEFAPQVDEIYDKVPLTTRMRSFLRGRQESIEKLLKEMVNINTYVRNVEGVNNLANIVKKYLSALGFSYRSYSQVEIGNILFFTNSDSENYDILLIANLDNNLKLSQQEHFSESEQKLYGTGIWENKGGLVILIAALQSLRFARLLRKLKIGILLTADDNLQGKFSRDLVRSKSGKADYIIGLHGAFLNGGIVTSRSGAAVYNCNMSMSKNMESPDVPAATSKFLKLIASWSDLSDPENGLAISASDVRMDSNITEPYAHASVILSVRFNDTSQWKIIDEKLKKSIPKKTKNGITYQFEGGLRRPSMVRTAKVGEFWQSISRLANSLDINLREEHRWSSADICFVEEEKFIIDGLGPAGEKPTNKSEYILRHSLLERSALLAILLSKIKNFED
jgi:D-alanine-D-alanine ligase